MIEWQLKLKHKEKNEPISFKKISGNLLSSEKFWTKVGDTLYNSFRCWAPVGKPGVCQEPSLWDWWPVTDVVLHLTGLNPHILFMMRLRFVANVGLGPNSSLCS